MAPAASGCSVGQLEPKSDRGEWHFVRTSQLQVDGSPIDDAVAYRCRYRAVPGSSFLRDDLCIVDPIGRASVADQLPDTPRLLPAGARAFRRGRTELRIHRALRLFGCGPIRFSVPWDPSQSVCSGTVHYQHDEIYRINRDGTGAQAITRSAAVKCSPSTAPTSPAA